jgi:two-component system response regulator YesN
MHSVLLVDDEPFVRLAIANLGPWGAEGFELSAEAGNGAEALAILAERPEIDMVLLDLSMPVMDGLAFLRRLAEARPRRQPAVVVLSAHDDYHLVREAFTLGARDYLLKSELDSDSLRAVLAKAGAGSAESQERDAAILERRHVELLKGQVLRDLLTVSGPGARDLEETFQGLGIGLAPPFLVACFWVKDLGAVAARQGADGMVRFSELAASSLAQVLAKWGRGEVVAMEPGHAAVLFSPPAQAAAFGADAAEYVGRYLSVKVGFALGPVCGAVAEAAASYQAARASRCAESRIVVLARRAIRERFAEPGFSLEDASLAVGVSKNHLSFEFSRETGETFTECLSRTRVEEARRLLGGTALLVYEVGERVGYPNVEHFSRVFKKLTGVSPARYKAEQA